MHTLLKHVKNATRSEICSNRIKLTCLDRLDRQTDTVTLHRDPAKDYANSVNKLTEIQIQAHSVVHQNVWTAGKTRYLLTHATPEHHLNDVCVRTNRSKIC